MLLGLGVGDGPFLLVHEEEEWLLDCYKIKLLVDLYCLCHHIAECFENGMNWSIVGWGWIVWLFIFLGQVLRKKCPSALLLASGDDRYDPSMWICSTIWLVIYCILALGLHAT